MKELIPITMFIALFAMIFALRYFSNREKMAMIERGIDPRLSKSAPTPFLSLKFGLLLIGVGIGLIIPALTIGSKYGPESVAIYFGSVGIFGGLGLVVSYIFEKKWLDQQ